MTNSPLVEVRDLSVHFPLKRQGFRGRPSVVRAVDGISFEVRKGETLGLVGESGSGKTTTGRAVLRRVDPTHGTITFRGQRIDATTGEELRRMRRHMQMVFQDPYGSLNPRMRILDIVAEPLIVHGLARSKNDRIERVADLLAMTGMPPDAMHRYPHAFSGGQRQRIGIARALAADPEFLVVDEPVAALDTSIQAQVVNLLQDLQDRLGVSYLFIAHDLSVVRHISDRVAIMYAGRLAEVADAGEIFDRPAHPYSKALLSAVPIPDPSIQRHRRRMVIGGEVPDLSAEVAGCSFASRCPYRQPERCETEAPALREVAPGHAVACHWAEEIEARTIRPVPVAVRQTAPF